jgi:DNA repair photolyase
MPTRHHKGRGAVSDRAGRFAVRPLELDAEEAHERSLSAPDTELRAMRSRRIIASNDSPDVPFDRSINPYQGCEHGCVYCYARPSHSYLDLSPGLDFESKIFYKPDAAARLAEEWEKPSYQCKPITLGANTDPYQPAERTTRVTRELLELFLAHSHPVSIITKGTLITRDLDLLEALARRRLCSVAISLPTMKRELKRVMEPRVPSADARLRAIEQLASAGVPVSVLFAPVIPALNDDEIEQVLESASNAGAREAAYIFLRLPHEVKDIFTEWLQVHFPDRAARVMGLVREASGGRDYDNRFGIRQTGRGPYADMLGKRFRAACRRYGLDTGRHEPELDCSRFDPPGQQQLGLF